ncbi:LOW QUALITY PROTEIN: hypothetical protein ENUP19_0385G0006 [Entamoeba nuttalli]|uniref:Dentin sialophospho protein n=1 Tax=Entamoeba nuttalli TaxID=412467 RepID=A0ABQ0DZF6_9EUKA
MNWRWLHSMITFLLFIVLATSTETFLSKGQSIKENRNIQIYSNKHKRLYNVYNVHLKGEAIHEVSDIRQDNGEHSQKQTVEKEKEQQDLTHKTQDQDQKSKSEAVTQPTAKDQPVQSVPVSSTGVTDSTNPASGSSTVNTPTDSPVKTTNQVKTTLTEGQQESAGVVPDPKTSIQQKVPNTSSSGINIPNEQNPQGQTGLSGTGVKNEQNPEGQSGTNEQNSKGQSGITNEQNPQDKQGKEKEQETSGTNDGQHDTSKEKDDKGTNESDENNKPKTPNGQEEGKNTTDNKTPNTPTNKPESKPENKNDDKTNNSEDEDLNSHKNIDGASCRFIILGVIITLLFF